MAEITIATANRHAYASACFGHNATALFPHCANTSARRVTAPALTNNGERGLNNSGYFFVLGQMSQWLTVLLFIFVAKIYLLTVKPYNLLSFILVVVLFSTGFVVRGQLVECDVYKSGEIITARDSVWFFFPVKKKKLKVSENAIYWTPVVLQRFSQDSLPSHRLWRRGRASKEVNLETAYEKPRL